MTTALIIIGMLGLFDLMLFVACVEMEKEQKEDVTGVDYTKLCKDFDSRYCYENCNWFEQCEVRELADREACNEKEVRYMRRDV